MKPKRKGGREQPSAPDRKNSSGDKRPKMNSTEIVLTINRQQLVDIVAAHLYAISAINDDVEIKDIHISGDNPDNTMTLKIFTKKKREIIANKRRVSNGT